MGVWSVAIESHGQDTLWGQFSWTQQTGGFAGLLGRAPARLTSRDQAFANHEAGRCSTCARNSALPRAVLDMEMGCRAKSNWSLPDDAEAQRPAEPDGDVSVETVSNLSHRGQLTEAVEALGVLVQTDSCISPYLLYDILKKCVAKKDLVLGRRIHAFTVRKGYESDTFLCNHILRMYASHGRLHDAMDVFQVVAKPDAFMWSSIISAHVKQGQDKQALQLYHQMRSSSVKPDGHVFAAALQACARGSDLKTGQQVHADVLASGVEPDLFICSCLVDMYGKCGSLDDAQRVFDGLGQKDVVTWNSMIAGYAQQGMGQEALRLYSTMQDEGIVTPDCVTFVCLLQACASMGSAALEKGQQLHAEIREQGHNADVFVASSLVNMYAKCGSLEDARVVFEGLGRKDVVTWNAMIAGYTQQGMGQEALCLYGIMQEEGISAPNSVTFLCLLQACASVGISALETGRQIHLQIRERGHQADVYVANSLVNMYAKCGSLEDAQIVFDGLGQKDVVTWTALIAGYSQWGRGQEALRLYSVLQEEGIAVPNSVTFVCLLQACANVGAPALEKGKQLHAQIREGGHQADVFVASSLVNMYAKCGSLEEAQRVFDGLGQKEVVTWTALIAGYSHQGMGQEALHLYSAMQQESIAVPDSVTFVCLLQACASIGTPALEKGQQLHSQIRERGYQTDVFVANSLLSMYAKCGSLEDAQEVFDGLGHKDVVTWNAMIAGYSQQGMGQEALRIYSLMQGESNAVPDSVTFLCLLQACAIVGIPALEKGMELHTQIREKGLDSDVFVSSSLVNMYAKCGSLEDAQRVFDRLGKKDVVTWTALIAGYSQQGMGQEALRVYSAMQEEGITIANAITYVCLLQACASVGSLALEKGKQLHTQIRGRGYQADVFVANSLVNMYAKCGSLEDAQSVFDGLGQKDVVTWNALIAGYSQKGMGQEALRLYSVMQDESASIPDSVTFLSLLQACVSEGTSALQKGKQLHAQIRGRGYQGDVFVANSLVNMYAKCGSLEDAQRVFDHLEQKDVVAWTSLIGGYSQQGMGQEALRCYAAMQEEGLAVPDSMTFACLLQACADVSALHLGRQLHAQIETDGLQGDAFVASSLINMYGKCGSMVDAQQVFDALPEPDVVAWSALIAGYTSQGDSEVVFDLVQRMREDGIQPVDITFLSVLTACSHAGLLDNGREYFDAMSRDYGLTPTVDHYTCMVDILGRAGRLEEALSLVSTMPVSPNAAIWHTLLGACRKWSNLEIGRHAFDQAVKLDEKDAAAYVLMSNIYTGVQMWEQAQEMQVRRTKVKAWKQPGQSWWTDVDGLVHSFLVGDRETPKTPASRGQSVPKLRKEGYLPIAYCTPTAGHPYALLLDSSPAELSWYLKKDGLWGPSDKIGYVICPR